ncbi:MAG: Rrf2 family transcriptional regulator, iron-sulfur cluster assembly transcription factor [Aliidongia sp.]|jgi:Rrf2 family iron-sulfur cluster assembly transcriptional regulator|nr:Rrf2 family transcriptional regulator, iron-sulfur cluster assembly transcription factor [Aliidongia sp.]
MAIPQHSSDGETLLAGLAAWLPRRFLLAIDIMLDVSFNGAVGPLPAAELGQRQGLETRKLEAILQRLSRAGLLKSVRGPNGGYLLGDERGAITIGAICRAVLDPDKPTPFDQSPSASMRKVVLPMVERVHQQMLGEFDRISLGDLCRESRMAGLASKCDGMVDFVI